MPIPYLEAHTKDADGVTRGEYTHIPCTISNIRKAHNAVEVHHSLYEGDRMTFHQILTTRDNELDMMRPIRFYNKDPNDSGVKLFDGVVINTDYTYIGNDYMALKVEAAGWWRELARMDLHNPITYDATESVDDIYADLVRIANNLGMMKEAVYKYDTTKIPEHGTYSTEFAAATGTEFVFINIYEGMKTLTQYMDAATSCTYEFGLRVESLPRLDGITQSNTEDYIYILPIPLNQDKTADATFKRFQLVTGMDGYEVRRDYSRLANNCFAFGNGIQTQQIRTTQPGEEETVNLTDYWWAKDNDTQTDHYLKITVENPTGTDFNSGYMQIVRTGPNTETFPVRVSAGETQEFYTSERVQLVAGNCFRAVGLTNMNGMDGCKITVEEISNDTSPYNTTIAGHSINKYGYAGKTIHAMWLKTQAQVDHIAGKHCRLYHAPTYQLYAPVLPSHTSYDNLIGNTAEFYSPYSAALDEFLITDTIYGFRGTQVTQHLMGMRYEFDWDYDETIYVVTGINDDQVVTGINDDYVVL